MCEGLSFVSTYAKHVEIETFGPCSWGDHDTFHLCGTCSFYCFQTGTCSVWPECSSPSLWYILCVMTRWALYTAIWRFPHPDAERLTFHSSILYLWSPPNSTSRHKRCSSSNWFCLIWDCEEHKACFTGMFLEATVTLITQHRLCTSLRRATLVEGA